jgi:multidrug transporter EmrE-like cation transporter
MITRPKIHAGGGSRIIHARLGIWLFGDSASLPRLACLAMIALGIVGLRFVSG